MSIPDLLIVGGGVVGLSVADCALREGLRVTVIDKGAEAGREASWAGAGMLTCRPHRRRSPNIPDIHDLTFLSVQLYAQWAARLLEETGIDVGYRVCGALETIPASECSVALLSEIDAHAAACRERGVEANRIDEPDIRQLQPNIGPGIVSALHFPNEAQVRNPRLLKALAASIVKRGGAICFGAEAADIDIDFSVQKVRGAVMANGERIAAPAVTVCAGAWTSRLPALKKVAPSTGKISPVRGQLLRYQADPELCTSLLTLGRNYIVPRGDGTYLVGATHENAGYVKETTPDGINGLRKFAHRILPELEKLGPQESWAGLRPGLKGKHPLIGQVRGIAGLFVAAGHFRNGIVLAPVTAELLVDTILNRIPKIPVEAWQPN